MPTRALITRDVTVSGVKYAAGSVVDFEYSGFATKLAAKGFADTTWASIAAYIVATGVTPIPHGTLPIDTSQFGSVRLAFAGDSLPANGVARSSVSGSALIAGSFQNNSWAYWLNFIGKQRYDYDSTFSVAKGSTTSTYMLAQLSAMLAKNCGIWIISVGTNDFWQAADSDVASGLIRSTLQANVTTVIRALTAAGSRVIILPIFPRSPSVPTTNVVQQTQLYNDWIRRTVAFWPGVAICDPMPQFTLGSDANYAWKSGLSTDLVHPDCGACISVAIALDAILQKFVPARDRLPSSAAQVRGAQNVTGFVNSAWLMSGSVASPGAQFATSGGTLPTGNLPTGYTCATFAAGPTATCSVAADPDVNGAQQTTVTFGGTGANGTGSNPGIQLRNDIAQAGGNFAGGDVVEFVGYMKLTAATKIRAATNMLRYHNGSAYVDLFSCGADDTNNSQIPDGTTIDGVFRSMPTTIPDDVSATGLRLQSNIYCVTAGSPAISGSMVHGRWGLWNLGSATQVG